VGGPLLLAVESATPATSVALLRGDAVLAEVRRASDRPTAESLLPAVDALLREAGAALADVEAFAVSIGPGSFTGLRIGLATVKGLAFGTRRLAVAVPTLAALARRAPPGPGPVVAMLDARRGEVYAASYEGAAAEPAAPRLEGVFGAAELAAQLRSPCRLVGEGVAVCGEALRRALGPGVVLVPPPRGEPRAAEVGALGAALLAQGAAVDPAELVPRYQRRAQAEVLRTGQPFEPARAAPVGVTGSRPRREG
jgi:tRNA threonylcarbamoyladenosine biosynthesis protein TsaB